MRIQINLSGEWTPKVTADLCACIGYNADGLISEYMEWKSSNARKDAKFEVKSRWFYCPDFKFRITCDGRTMHITEIKKPKS